MACPEDAAARLATECKEPGKAPGSTSIRQFCTRSALDQLNLGFPCVHMDQDFDNEATTLGL